MIQERPALLTTADDAHLDSLRRPRTFERLRIADEAHGPADLAAALIMITAEAGPSWAAFSRLAGEVERLGCDSDNEVLQDVGWLMSTVRDHEVMLAARLGFAFALTLDSSTKGWPAWIEAARAVLDNAHCTPEEHGPGVLDHIQDALEKVRSTPVDPAARARFDQRLLERAMARSPRQ